MRSTAERQNLRGMRSLFRFNAQIVKKVCFAARKLEHLQKHARNVRKEQI